MREIKIKFHFLSDIYTGKVFDKKHWRFCPAITSLLLALGTLGDTTQI